MYSCFRMYIWILCEKRKTFARSFAAVVVTTQQAKIMLCLYINTLFHYINFIIAIIIIIVREMNHESCQSQYFFSWTRIYVCVCVCSLFLCVCRMSMCSIAHVYMPLIMCNNVLCIHNFTYTLGYVLLLLLLPPSMMMMWMANSLLLYTPDTRILSCSLLKYHYHATYDHYYIFIMILLYSMLEFMARGAHLPIVLWLRLVNSMESQWIHYCYFCIGAEMKSTTKKSHLICIRMAWK